MTLRFVLKQDARLLNVYKSEKSVSAIFAGASNKLRQSMRAVVLLARLENLQPFYFQSDAFSV